MNERTCVPSPRGWLRRAPSHAARVLVAAVVSAVALLAFTPSSVLADNTVVSSEPADGSTVATSPESIVIVFAEDLGEQNTIAVDCDAELFTLGRSEVGEDGRTLTAEVVDPLPAATCLARWRVSDTEGEPNGSGNITFSVQNDPAVSDTTEPDSTDPAATPATSAPSADGDDTASAVPTSSAAADVAELENVDSGEGPLWLGRLLSVLGVAVVFGSLVLIAAAWPEGVEYLLAVRFIRSAWIVALLGTLLYVAAASAAVTGESLGAGLNPGSWLDLLDAGWAGRAALARLLLVVVSGWVAFRPDRVIDPTTQLAGLGIPLLAVVTIGFSRTEGDLALVGVLMAVVHAVAMAVWVGGVVLLARVVLAGPGEEDLVHAVRGFGRLSNLAIIATVVSGLVQLVRLDGGSLFSSDHGRVLLLKVVAVAVMIFVAISARQLVQHRLARAHEMSVPMSDRLRRAFGTEAAIGVVVLAASAWLLALTPPNVDTTPEIDYAVELSFEVEEADFEVEVRLTSDRATTQGLEVEVLRPESGLSTLEVVFTAPPNDEVGSITQPVPLTGTGVAVRPQGDGLPLVYPGDWAVQVNAQTASGTLNSEPQQLTLLNPDGSAPTTALTIPETVVVTIDPNATTTTLDGG